MKENSRSITHGIVHAGFRGFRALVARKKSHCILIGNRLVIPHDTIPSTVTVKRMKKKPRY
jgi:mannitol/fructose-specific phosphotransferase system IIA component